MTMTYLINVIAADKFLKESVKAVGPILFFSHLFCYSFTLFEKCLEPTDTTNMSNRSQQRKTSYPKQQQGKHKKFTKDADRHTSPTNGQICKLIPVTATAADPGYFQTPGYSPSLYGGTMYCRIGGLFLEVLAEIFHILEKYSDFFRKNRKKSKNF